MMPDPVAVSVVTGFLGAGKTTLLNRLLKDPALTDTAVIINEFGEIAIDHLLVEQASDGVIELSDGCLCCTVRGELVDTLADLIDRVQTGKIGPLKRVIVETTGLADPVPVLQSIMGHPVLVQAYRLDGVIALVDAVNGAATLDNHEEAVRQVAVADRIVVTKGDLAAHPGTGPQFAAVSASTPTPYPSPQGGGGSETLASNSRLRADGSRRDYVNLLDRLRRLNPTVPILDIKNTRPETLFDTGLYDPATKSVDVGRWLGETSDGHDHAHHDHGHGHHDHDHDNRHRHGRHDSRVKSFSLSHDRPIPYAAVDTFLELLRSLHGERLLRMKGIVQLAEQPERPLVLHAVQKLMHPPVRLPQWPDGQRSTRLVIIGFDLPEDYVHRLFAAITDRPSVDQPDRAALQDNPLAIPGS